MSCSDMDFPDIPETEQELWNQFDVDFKAARTKDQRGQAIARLLDGLGVPPGPEIDFRQFRPMLCVDGSRR